MSEATLQDGVPVTAGWFVVNARDAPWLHNAMRTVCRFGGEGEAHFDDLGIGLYWLEPGRPMALYHHEAGQEDFLVLRGRCTLVIEGEERSLRPWDLVHCPPRTAHTIVAGDDGPALVLAVGARKEKGSARYPVEPVAIRHGAGVPHEATSADEVKAGFGTPQRGHPPTLAGLEMRGACERCGAPLGADGEARICSYECTFCPECADAMSATCPNCGGELVRARAGVTPETQVAKKKM